MQSIFEYELDNTCIIKCTLFRQCQQQTEHHKPHEDKHHSVAELLLVGWDCTDVPDRVAAEHITTVPVVYICGVDLYPLLTLCFWQCILKICEFKAHALEYMFAWNKNCGRHSSLCPCKGSPQNHIGMWVLYRGRLFNPCSSHDP